MDNIFITVIDRKGESHVLEAPLGIQLNLMEVCKMYDLPVKGTCGGMALCSTCHVYVESEADLPEQNDAEIDMMDQAFFVQSNSRLGCQLPIDAYMDGMVVRLAPESE